jgi:2-dehydropantoate 2-reductase
MPVPSRAYVGRPSETSLQAMSHSIQSIFVIGLGALGAKYASRLHEFYPGQVKIIASIRRVEQFKIDPITVNGVAPAFEFVTPDTTGQTADLLIFAVKFDHLKQAIDDARPFISAHTSVMSLLNGVTSEELIADAYGKEQVLLSSVYMDAVRDGNHIRYADIGRIVFGERRNDTMSGRVAAIRSKFENAGIPCDVPGDMVRAQWKKFMLNVGVNQASAVLQASYGAFQHESHARKLMVSAAEEVVAIAQASGIELNRKDIDEMVAIINSLVPTVKTSMLQDGVRPQTRHSHTRKCHSEPNYSRTRRAMAVTGATLAIACDRLTAPWWCPLLEVARILLTSAGSCPAKPSSPSRSHGFSFYHLLHATPTEDG